MELQCSFNAVVNQKVNDAKEEIYAKVQQDTDFIDLKNDVKAKCEAERLETYNRRENVKIVNLRENVDENGQIVREDMEDTMLKVNELAKDLDNRYDVKDLSIAHRLPTRRGNIKPIIARFLRRIAKVCILRMKETLFEKGSEIRIFEDVSQPRVNFVHMMKNDNRLNSVFTRDGIIHYTRNDENRRYRVNNLYHGALDLGYSLEDLHNCFR